MKTKIEKAREAADKWIKKNGIGKIGMRSCWICNSGHEHLKKADYPFWCFSCGHQFFKGLDITDEYC